MSYPLNTINISKFHTNITNPCGYCTNRSKTWSTSGFTCPLMSPSNYEKLIEQGWRRCGIYYYKPEIDKCCCKPYSIRLEVEKFKMKNSQIKALKKFENFIRKGNDPLLGFNEEKKALVQQIKNDDEAEILGRLENIMEVFHQTVAEDKEWGFLKLEQEASKVRIMKQCSLKADLQFYSNVFFIYYKQWKDLQNNIQDENASFKEFFDIFTLVIHNFLKDYLDINNFKIYKSGYVTFFFNHNASYFLKKASPEISNKKFNLTNFCKLRIKIIKAKFEEESFLLYKKYCKEVHNTNETTSNYENFLCMQALEEALKKVEGQEQTIESEDLIKLGCYHMKYYVDDRLIAVGVVDVLPKSLSSVYFFYDPGFKKYSPGVIGCMKEIEFIRNQNQIANVFKYYYLGYYIHKSKKMSYKGDYEPSQLLCPISLKWVDFKSEIRKKLEMNPENIDLISEDKEFEEKKEMESRIDESEIINQELLYNNEIKRIYEFKNVNNLKKMMNGLARLLGKEIFEIFLYRI